MELQQVDCILHLLMLQGPATAHFFRFNQKAFLNQLDEFGCMSLSLLGRCFARPFGLISPAPVAMFQQTVQHPHETMVQALGYQVLGSNSQLCQKVRACPPFATSAARGPAQSYSLSPATAAAATFDFGVSDHSRKNPNPEPRPVPPRPKVV